LLITTGWTQRTNSKRRKKHFPPSLDGGKNFQGRPS